METNIDTKLFLKDLLLHIDEYQYIKIKCHGDVIYDGQRRYFIPSDIHSDIGVLNILTDYKNNYIYSIIICIDKTFG